MRNMKTQLTELRYIRFHNKLEAAIAEAKVNRLLTVNRTEVRGTCEIITETLLQRETTRQVDEQV